MGCWSGGVEQASGCKNGGLYTMKGFPTSGKQRAGVVTTASKSFRERVGVVDRIGLDWDSSDDDGACALSCVKRFFFALAPKKLHIFCCFVMINQAAFTFCFYGFSRLFSISMDISPPGYEGVKGGGGNLCPSLRVYS